MVASNVKVVDAHGVLVFRGSGELRHLLHWHLASVLLFLRCPD